MFKLKNSIGEIRGIGPKKTSKFIRLNIFTIADLLYFFPRDYIIKDDSKKIKDLNENDVVSLDVEVATQCVSKRTYKGLTITKFLVSDDTGSIWVTIFNRSYISKQLKLGDDIRISGKVNKGSGSLEFTNPNIEFNNISREVSLITPVYSTTEGLTQTDILKIQKEVIEKYSKEVKEFITDDIRTEEKLCNIGFALENIHFPSSIKNLKLARYRLIFEEFFLLQLSLMKMKKHTLNEFIGKALINNEGIDSFISSLPFELTESQLKILDEIFLDLESTKSMNRLVQGDVGSGKTIVAIIALFKCIINNCQGAFMAPTEILAEQHFNIIESLLKPLGINVGLLTGKLKKSNKEELLQNIKNGHVQVVVGTHALIQENVVFKDLALVITDEQHRFGVRQRAILSNKGDNPHVLVMSATPIPRTLALILYGDLDISIIDQLPKGRKKIKTKAVSMENKYRVYDSIKKELDLGRQAYVVCPLVEESEAIDAQSVTEKVEELKMYFPKYEIGILHGKMNSAEKDEIMLRFKNNEIHILVATTVIEVGIDVPNSTIILIENAERFGLAQLHQLRGRVGRGSEQSYCFLLYKSKNKISEQRLKIMEETTDGFIISEKDLELRGPGDFFGIRQHGIMEFKIANVFKHIKILKKVQNRVELILKEDPLLTLEKYPALGSVIKDKLLNFDGI